LSKNTQRGFTLLELLVVIAIVAILISLLLPALRSAKDSAKSVFCSNNLHQLSLAAMYYADDYKGYFPDARGSPDTTGPAPNWNYEAWTFVVKHYLAQLPGSIERLRVMPGGTFDSTYPELPFETRNLFTVNHNDYDNVRYNRANPIYKNPFFCPATIGGYGSSPYSVNAGNYQWGDYGMNVGATGSAYLPLPMPAYWNRVHRDQIRNHNRLMLFSDQAGAYNLFYNSLSPSARHFNFTRSNVVCMDGHVASCRNDMDWSDPTGLNEIQFDTYGVTPETHRYKATVVRQ